MKTKTKAEEFPGQKRKRKREINKQRPDVRMGLPVPLSDLERIGLSISARSQVVDPPLGEARGGFNAVSRVSHPRKDKGRRDFMDAVQ